MLIEPLERHPGDTSTHLPLCLERISKTKIINWARKDERTQRLYTLESNRQSGIAHSLGEEGNHTYSFNG